MDAAATTVIGAAIPIDISTTRYPDRFAEKDGAAMFARVVGLLASVENREAEVEVR